MRQKARSLKQIRLAATNFERYRKTTRREAFFAEMDRIVPSQNPSCRDFDLWLGGHDR
jgi:hypothetical protein